KMAYRFHEHPTRMAWRTGSRDSYGAYRHHERIAATRGLAVRVRRSSTTRSQGRPHRSRSGIATCARLNLAYEQVARRQSCLAANAESCVTLIVVHVPRAFQWNTNCASGESVLTALDNHAESVTHTTCLPASFRAWHKVMPSSLC